ncbi:NAD(P)-binding protein [Violaceomyces palustris]|uniref:NAD(P)-binding protein n=1 Tax=Violaceomyces palustris TaxID=1673888 RepID=A0ACD0P8T2_9BASI|nr:NAD(P)-binding protein [Violaceomyces palustris]
MERHQLNEANKVNVRDERNQVVNFGRIREQAIRDKVALLVVLTRHFHCGMCMDYIKALAKSEEIMSSSAVRVVVVGPGQADCIQRYSAQCGQPLGFSFLADPKVELYKALGVTARSLDLGDSKKSEVASHHSSNPTTSILKSVAAISTSGTLAFKGGDFKQLGAEFIFDKNGQCIHAHRMRNTRDHTEVSKIVATLEGVQEKSSPSPTAAPSTSEATKSTPSAGAGLHLASSSAENGSSPIATEARVKPGIVGQGLLPGKFVAITGASRGIGKACALACAAHGAKGILVHYLGDEETTREADSLAEELKQLGAEVALVPGDISDQRTGETIASTAKQVFGRLDVLISNAGICPFASFLEMKPELWERVRRVNLDGAFFTVQACARLMSEQSNPRGGSIVAISSISALCGGEMQSHYTPTKAGLKSLMESASISLGKLGIRCNSVLPGTIETEINREDLKDSEKRDYMISRSPLGRLGRPEDIAGPAVFLASDLAQYMTGSSVLVDGGVFVNLQ